MRSSSCADIDVYSLSVQEVGRCTVSAIVSFSANELISTRGSKSHFYMKYKCCKLKSPGNGWLTRSSLSP